MQVKEQVLIVDPPQELCFKGPFTDMVTSYLKLTNPIDKDVCFKIKTTAPRRYCVKPNSGLIRPKETATVAVVLQPAEFDPTDKSKHKFMVQSVLAPEGSEAFENIWKNVNPEALMDTKLKCVFVMPTDNPFSSPQNSGETKVSDEEKTDYKNMCKEQMQSLTNELAHLREQNSRLKLRSTDVHRVPSSSTGIINKEGVSSGRIPLVYWVATFIFLVLGILLGKFLL